LFTTPNIFSHQQVYYVVFVQLLINTSFQVRTRTVATVPDLGATLNLFTPPHNILIILIRGEVLFLKMNRLEEVLASEESKESKACAKSGSHKSDDKATYHKFKICAIETDKEHFSFR
jgi:hypothetical protein